MDSEDPSDIRVQFGRLSKGAYLDVLIPKSSAFDASAVLKNASPEELSRASSRRHLFFDENATLSLILKTSRSPAEVHSLLPSLELVLGAHATDAVPQGGNAASASGKHDLTSKTIPASEFTDVVPVGDRTYILWRPALHIPRPRVRLQRPAIYFTANLNVMVQALEPSKPRSTDYLTPYEPLPTNVLEPLRFDHSFSSTSLYLSETRITSVAPATPAFQDDVKPIRGASKRAFPVVPALFNRIKYTKVTESVVASLHIETSTVAADGVTIQSVSLRVPDTEVEDLTQQQWPKATCAGDEHILLYRFKGKLKDNLPGPSAVSVTITATTSLDECLDIDLEIQWEAHVDLSQTAPEPIYKWSRPLSSGSLQLPSRQSLHGSTRPSSSDGAPAFPAVDAGVTFKFTASPTAKFYDELKVDVHCLNRSPRTRRFALVVAQPWRKTVQSHRHTSSDDGKLTNNPSGVGALEEPSGPDVLELKPDVRVGPLRPGASYETQIVFRVMNTGVLDLGVLRIVDLDTRQTVDVRDLPDVIALESDWEWQDAEANSVI